MSLIPWEEGRSILWDFTACHTLASSHLSLANQGAGKPACSSEELKRRKYASLSSSFLFAPVCIETLGAWGDSAKSFIRQIGKRVKDSTGEPRSAAFLIQRLAIDVQRGNAASVLATLPCSRDWLEVGYLPLS